MTPAVASLRHVAILGGMTRDLPPWVLPRGALHVPYGNIDLRLPPRIRVAVVLTRWCSHNLSQSAAVLMNARGGRMIAVKGGRSALVRALEQGAST